VAASCEPHLASDGVNEAAAAWHDTVMARQNGNCAVTGDVANDWLADALERKRP
jgi:hypothetical protein